MRPDKEKALALRRKGKSYREIVKCTGIPKGTLFEWFHSLEWSKKIKEDLSQLQNQNARQRMIIITDRIRKERAIIYEKNRNEARQTFKKNFNHSLFVAGIMLYKGEGDNSMANSIIRIANSDPMVLQYFRLFIEKYFPALFPRLKMYLILYPDLDDTMCLKYWSNQVGIPFDRFIKSQYIQGRSLKRSLPYGTAQLYITHRASKYKLLEWISLARQHIQPAGIV